MPNVATQPESPEKWPVAEPPKGALCPGCGKDTPAGELDYPVVGKGPRQLMCEPCRGKTREEFATYCAEVQHRKTTKTDQQRIERFVGLAKKADEQSAPTIHLVLTTLVDQLGGIESFVATWAGQINKAIEDHPGSQKVLDAFKGIANLLAAATPRLEIVTKWREMSDDELLRRETMASNRALLLRVIEEKPEAAPYLEQYLIEPGNGKHDEPEQDA